MKQNKIFLLIILIFITLFEQTICFANSDTQSITILTPPGGQTVKQICNEINKQVGETIALVSKDFKDSTIDIELKNMNREKSMLMIKNIICSKYGDCAVSKEGPFYIIKKAEPLFGPNETFHCHKLKYVSFDYLKSILLEKIPDSKKILRISYYDVSNSIVINCKDDKSKHLILQILEKYDVESNNLNKNHLQNVSIQSAPNGMTINQLIQEFKKQTGNSFIVEKALQDFTMEVEINNIDLEEALRKILNKYNNYKPYPKKRADIKKYLVMRKENDTYIIGRARPLVDEREIYLCHKLEHISYETLKKIILESIPNSEKLLSIFYNKNNNDILINSIDEDLYSLINQIVQKYDVELTSTNENILKSIQFYEKK